MRQNREKYEVKEFQLKKKYGQNSFGGEKSNGMATHVAGALWIATASWFGLDAKTKYNGPE